jgi:tetratricopeptide (TPR) repeat protein
LNKIPGETVNKLAWGFALGAFFAPFPSFAAGKEKPKPTPAAKAPSFGDFKSAYAAGNQALKEKRWEEAAADYAAAEGLAGLSRPKAEAANAGGWALLKGRKWKEASEAFDRAVGYDPKGKVAFHNSGYALSKMYQYGLAGAEDLKKAVERLEVAAALDASYKPEFLERARTDLAREQAYAQATPVAASRLKALDYKTLLALGDKAQSQGQFDLALKVFKQAETSALSPKSKGAAANRMGMALLDGRRPREAVPHFQRAVDYQPKEKVFLNNLGLDLWVLYDSGKGTSADLKRAVDCFYKANSMDPSFHAENLAMALEELREAAPEEAKAYNLKKEEPAAEESGRKKTAGSKDSDD